MHHNQMSVISGMEDCFNILKSINVTHDTNTLKKKTNIIISLEAEKTFDDIQCLLMIKIHHKLGIEMNFLT